ncbi:MAG: glycerol kinase GlpK [Candidatus Binatus sp.]|uniref:glycerol kinase GlpK n=1 Tax=Candidatus Binatus sp. TaxID=2811406 RepID=UPI00271939CC|nr:glycerol kinase GlpK [Candidatus Binatus sp.]MDO8434231.1 glycerol kinase GlpK [Candidatus Binatus sp.]
MPQVVLAIDQGTTGTTVFVVDGRGRIRGRAYAEVRQFYPKPGWVEHDPEEIYRSVIALSKKAIAQSKVGADAIKAVGITNQRETFVVWDRRSGKPIHRAIVWQCRRSAAICDVLRDRESEVIERTGLIVDPYFSGTKLKWLLDEKPELRRRAARGELCFGTIDTWLIYKLTRGAGFVTDYTNASRTMMFNLARMEWDDEMLAMLEVPREMLPAAVSSRGPLAETLPGMIAARAIPIGAVIGDQQSALFGQGAVDAGDSKATYGTGAFLLMNTGDKIVRSRNRLLTTAALGPEGEPCYALEGSVFIAGAAVQWLRDGLKLIRNAADSERAARLSRDRSTPYVVPAFVGLGAPHWDSGAKGAILGITRGTTRADIVRATLDSIAYQVRDVIVAMESDTGHPLSELRAAGGATENRYLMQFQADILGKRVRRAKVIETTAMGAAMLAGLAAGIWQSQQQLTRLHRGSALFKPKMQAAEREQLLAGWHDAVSRVLTTNARAIEESHA